MKTFSGKENVPENSANKTRTQRKGTEQIIITDDTDDDHESHHQEIMQETCPKGEDISHPSGEIEPELLTTLQQSKLATNQLTDTIQSIIQMPKQCQETITTSPYLPSISTQNTLRLTVSSETYTDADRILGRLLLKQAPCLLQTMVRYDLAKLCILTEPYTTAKVVRCYYYKKYGLQNKETLKLLEAQTMIEAINDLPKSKNNPQQDIAANQQPSLQQTEEGETSQQTEPWTASINKISDASEDRNTEMLIDLQSQTLPYSQHSATKTTPHASQSSEERTHPQKRTILELAQDFPITKEQQTTKDSRFSICDWESIGGAMQFRPTGIQKRNFEAGRKKSQTENEPTPELQPQSQRSTSQTREEQQPHIEEKTRPIGTLKERRDESDSIQREIQIKAGNNDLSDTEKLFLRRIKVEHGYSQHCEFINPDSRFIFRCPLCTSALNSNGIERCARVHFNRRHSNLQGLSQIRITRFGRKEFRFLIRGKNAPEKTSFKLPKLQPEQNQTDKPPRKNDSQFTTEGLEFEFDEGGE